MFVAFVCGGFFFVRSWRQNRSAAKLLPVASVKHELTVKQKPVIKEPQIELTPRQEVVYEIIRGKKMIEMKDLLPRIPSVTERTLRRDLLKLQDAGLISKRGTTKASTYVLNK
jgi:hypothetical protein